MELPVPPRDPAAGRGRAPGDRPGPGRLRAQRQAHRAVRLHLRPPRRVDAPGCCSTASTCATSPSSARTGAASSACASSPPTRTATPAWSSATPACPPATARPARPSSPGRSSPRRPSTSRSGGIINGGCTTDAGRPRSSPPTTHRSPTTPTRPAPASSPRSCRPSPDDPAQPRQRGGLGRCSRRFEQAVPARVQRLATRSPRAATRRSWPRCPAPQGQPHTTIEGGGHFLQEDRGPELAAGHRRLHRPHDMTDWRSLTADAALASHQLIGWIFWDPWGTAALRRARRARRGPGGTSRPGPHRSPPPATTS